MYYILESIGCIAVHIEAIESQVLLIQTQTIIIV